MARVLQGAWFTHEGRVQLGIVRSRDMEELGAVAGDVEGIVETLLNTTGVEVSVLFVERAEKRIKLSFRCRSHSDQNLALLASELSPQGGGHPRAAGALLSTSLEDAVRRVEQAVSERL